VGGKGKENNMNMGEGNGMVNFEKIQGSNPFSPPPHTSFFDEYIPFF
jgi:hypothetical protein